MSSSKVSICAPQLCCRLVAFGGIPLNSLHGLSVCCCGVPKGCKGPEGCHPLAAGGLPYVALPDSKGVGAELGCSTFSSDLGHGVWLVFGMGL